MARGDTFLDFCTTKMACWANWVVKDLQKGLPHFIMGSLSYAESFSGPLGLALGFSNFSRHWAICERENIGPLVKYFRKMK